MPVLLEIQYLPSIQYFTKLAGSEPVFIEQWEHYQKGTYRNRCHIAAANGLTRLTIPLIKGKNEQQAIREVRIAYYEPWQRQHWQSIRSAYGNAPFYEFYADALQPFYEKPFPFLFDFNLELLQTLLKLLRMDVTLQLTDAYVDAPPDGWEDLRNAIHPKPHLQKPDPHFTPKPYHQVFEDRYAFLPNLSLLDALFCLGPEAVVE
ncbi:MAG: WbqC family protein [Saprospiraceae bacterium]|nr:WbqC family protein [Saprospiraceae bacterium]